MKRVDGLGRDLVFAARLLRKSPVFTAAVVLTLALGLGVNTAVFSVVNAIILRPLPVRDAEQLVVIATHDTSSRTLRAMSYPDFEDYRAAAADVFEDVAGYTVGFLGLSARGAPPDRVLVTHVTENYFALLGIWPALGRVWRTSTAARGRVDGEVLLGYSTWQRRFAGDPSVAGQLVRVNGRPYTVAGVVPRNFFGTFAFSESELYLPMDPPSPDDTHARQSRSLHTIARLRRGVAIDRAQAAVDVVAERLAREHPDSNSTVRARVLPERFARPEEDQFRSNALGAAVMLALAAIDMIVAAVNVTNLLLARAASRNQELAIRAALGAGRGRLIRELLAESVMLVACGAGLGVLLGGWVARGLAAVRLPGDLPVRFDFALDARVLAYAIFVAVITVLLVGVVPAVRVSGGDLERTLRQPRHGPPGMSGRRVRGFLVAAQVALCFVLLAASASFVRSLFEAERADFGFQPDGVLNVHMDVGQLGYTEAQGRAFFDEIERRARSIPGVRNVSFAFTIPMGYIRLRSDVEPDQQAAGSRTRVSAGKNIVSAGYFETLGTRIVRGRSFGDADAERSRPVAIVNEQLAALLWPGRDPVGRRFRSAVPGARWVEVVGVVSTGKYQFLFEDPQPYFYVPIAQEYSGLRVLHLRASARPEALAPAVERTIRALEPNLPLYDVQSMRRALGSGLGFFPVRAGAVAVAALGVLAFALAVVGLYGVISYLISQRVHEIGVRMAVGATEHDIVRLVLQEGSMVVLFGVTAGLLLTAASSRVIGHFLYGVSAHDPLTLVSVAMLLGGVALGACLAPARRAARVDPTVALRSE